MIHVKIPYYQWTRFGVSKVRVFLNFWIFVFVGRKLFEHFEGTKFRPIMFGIAAIATEHELLFTPGWWVYWEISWKRRTPKSQQQIECDFGKSKDGNLTVPLPCIQFEKPRSFFTEEGPGKRWLILASNKTYKGVISDMIFFQAVLLQPLWLTSETEFFMAHT